MGSSAPPENPPATAAACELMSSTAKLLFANGQTTARTISAVERLGGCLGVRAELLPRWEHVTLRIEVARGAHLEIFNAAPAGVDMRKVIAAMDVVDAAEAKGLAADRARSALETAARLPPISLIRFALMAGAGAAALSVIFGANKPVSILLIAMSGALGACLRRWLAGKSHNLFVQPLAAALLAGLVGAIAYRFELSSALHLVAVCPCMILVPGPHLLNGAIDLARGRLPLGITRLAYAGLTILMICAGLLAGLTLGGVTLPPAGAGQPVPLVFDVVAAGLAVAAYGTFFSMPWRLLPIPIAVGMFAHALRWVAMSHFGANAELGAFIACLAVGTIMTPVANRLRLPFAGVAFASVVSLIPGVFLFRMASGILEFIRLGTEAPPALPAQVLADGATALLIFLCMAFGLLVPKMLLDSGTPPAAKSR